MRLWWWYLAIGDFSSGAQTREENIFLGYFWRCSKAGLKLTRNYEEYCWWEKKDEINLQRSIIIGTWTSFNFVEKPVPLAHSVRNLLAKNSQILLPNSNNSRIFFVYHLFIQRRNCFLDCKFFANVAYGAFTNGKKCEYRLEVGK